MKNVLFLLFCPLFLFGQYQPRQGTLRNIIAGENIPDYRFVYVKDTDGKAYKADPNDVTKAAVAVVFTGGNTNDTIQCFFGGENYWQPGGLIPGAPYYLDTNGHPTKVMPDEFHNSQVVGYAVTDSIMYICPMQTQEARWLYQETNINFAQTDENSRQSHTVSVTGAQVGMPVLLSWGADAEVVGVIFTARVTSANTVTVYANNTNSATKADPGSATFKIYVKK